MTPIETQNGEDEYDIYLCNNCGNPQDLHSARDYWCPKGESFWYDRNDRRYWPKWKNENYVMGLITRNKFLETRLRAALASQPVTMTEEEAPKFFALPSEFERMPNGVRDQI